MHVSSDQGAPGGAMPKKLKLEGDLSRLSHNLMGSISALLMCENLLSRELAPTDELANNLTLQTTLSLLKETADQIREHGDELMKVSRRYKQETHPGTNGGATA